jgi:hypothetical protein
MNPTKNKNKYLTLKYHLRVRVMVFNISVISWWSVLLVEETGVPVENRPPAASY